MFILPYFIKEKINSSGYTIKIISLFLENGGTQLLTLESCTVEEFCKENELSLISSFQKNGVCFACISPEKTNMKAFYSFHEKIAEGLEVWRTFLWVEDEMKKDVWTVNERLKEISVSNTTIYSLLQDVRTV